jgi:hypothetical protein
MRRRVTRYAELTSLLDVLFILLFAALIQAAGIVSAATEPVEPEPEPVAPTEPAQPAAAEHAELKQRAIDELTRSIGERAGVYARISRDGVLTAIEREHAGGAQRLDVDTPLVEVSDDADVGLIYLGERRPEWRLCTRIRVTLGVPDLSDRLVVFALDAPLTELPVALVEGLRADQEACFTAERGVAMVVPPEDTP